MPAFSDRIRCHEAGQVCPGCGDTIKADEDCLPVSDADGELVAYYHNRRGREVDCHSQLQDMLQKLRSANAAVRMVN